jgi:hypothetical protein
MLEGNHFIVRSEKGTSAFHILDRFTQEAREMTPENVRVLNEGLGTLHAAEELLRKRNYTDSD